MPNILISVPTKKVKQPLSVTHPELAKEADGWDPTLWQAQSSTKLIWKCNKSHRWSATLSDRLKGQGCAVCAGRQIQIGENDLASMFPELLIFIDGWNPESFTPHSNKRVNWKCSRGHTWTSTINNITSRERNLETPCPYCSNQRVWEGFNDLKTTHPELAIEAFDWDPSTVVAGSNLKRRWKCSLSHTWEAVVNSRSGSLKTGCPYCANQKVWSGFNDLATMMPELAAEADGWNPSEVTIRANRKLDWKCKLGHKWSALLSNRGKGVGCPVCANQKVLTGFNDLETSHPMIAKEAFEWDPKLIISKSSRPRKWKCPTGHIYITSPASRIRGDGCSYCSSHQLLKGFNDLKTNFPIIASQAYKWDPSTLMSQSNKVRKWICSEGHIWEASPANRVKDVGCPSCAKYGFDPNRDAYLYFLEHFEWGMFQIGITNNPDVRLTKHTKSGWTLIEIRGQMDGHLTQQWETAILRMLKAKGADLSNEKIAGKFDGYSEAWSKSTFEVSSIKELMRLTEEFESNNKI